MQKPLAVSPKEAMEMIGCKTTKFYEVLNAGLLDARKMGRRNVITVESIEKYLNSLPARPARPVRQRKAS